MPVRRAAWSPEQVSDSLHDLLPGLIQLLSEHGLQPAHRPLKQRSGAVAGVPRVRRHYRHLLGLALGELPQPMHLLDLPRVFAMGALALRVGLHTRRVKIPSCSAR